MKTITNGVGSELQQLTIRVASSEDRQVVYRLRHDVYALELGQHAARTTGTLSDPLDEFNVYLVAVRHGNILGFISITPPGFGRYSIDKYFARPELPFHFDGHLFEVRLLTVLKPQRGLSLAFLMMYAAFRWVEANGGTRIVGIGRREVLEMYRKIGLHPHGHEAKSGAVVYELMSAEVGELRKAASAHAILLNRLERVIEWRLEFPFQAPAKCFHGGLFFEAIGTEFDRLERRREIINADVLDAWFPPSPKVIEALRADLGWLLQTSPPADGSGLVRTIARVRGVETECILPAAGSSDLIFLALREWLTPTSRVLVLDPTYGEYAHVLEQVIRCRVECMMLARDEGYEVNLERLEECLQHSFDLVILVNPNSPTGRHVPRALLERLLHSISPTTRVWVDETYIEYAGQNESLEGFAANSRNVVVCKSMSKVYSLSGARAAYLCGPPEIIDELQAVTPPWAVSLPAQVAAVVALQDPEYYKRRYVETHQLREILSRNLTGIEGWEIVPGMANFLLCHVPETGAGAAVIVEECRKRGLFIRDASTMGSRLGRHALRIAVKDAETNERMVAILREVVAEKQDDD